MQIWKNGIYICALPYDYSFIWLIEEKRLVCKVICLHLDIMLCRILFLMEEATSASNLEEFKKNRQVFSTSSCFTQTVFDKTLTQGKVEGSVKVCLL